MNIYAQITQTGGNVYNGNSYGQILISIFDSATNQPANGNNCVVTYSISINGVQTISEATISGMSYPIYTGQLSGSNPFFTSNFAVISIAPGTPGPAVPTCDLQINSIVPTAETSAGSQDGRATVNATSSEGPIRYSLDNETWQDSNLFTGLLGGTYTAYVIDNNGCLDNRQFVINTGVQLLVADPTITIGGNKVSRWNAAFNPIFFIYQRKDFEMIQIREAEDGSGNILVDVNGDMSAVIPGSDIVVNQILTHVTGDLVYISTAKYQGTYEVLARNEGSLTLNCDYAGDDGPGFINIDSLRPYYVIQTKITFVDPITGKLNTITMSNRPLTNGYCRCDFSSFLKSLLQVKDSSDYTLINFRDLFLSASYQVQYAEIWDGNTPNWIVIPQPYYLLFAAKQLQENGGGNLVDYVPFLLGFQPAKWVTDFLMPVYNYGFPFDLGFIFSEYMVGIAPYYHITLLDINKNPLADQSIADQFLLDEDGGFILNEDGSKFIIGSQDVVNYPIVEHVGLNRLLLNFNPPANCYYFKVELNYTDTDTTVYPLMQPIICRIDQNTPDRSVYLRWLGLTGSWNYYRFVYNQAVTLEVMEAVMIKNFVIDWANSDTIEDVLSKNAGEKMTVYAENMTVDDIKGCQALKYSPKVQVLTASNPIKWQTVIIQTGTFNERETMMNEYNMSFTFALPSKNIQTQ